MQLDSSKPLWYLIAIMGGVFRVFLLVLITAFYLFPGTTFVWAIQSNSNQRENPGSLQKAFKAAAKEFGVPENVLLSVSYNLSRWEGHNGEPSMLGGYGPMHLTDMDHASFFGGKGEGIEKRPASSDPSFHTLDTAAKEMQINPDTLKQDPIQNIRGGAFLLAKYAKESLGKKPSNEADWYAAVAKYSGSQQEQVAGDFADNVYATVKEGKSRVTADGQKIILTGQDIKPNKDLIKLLHLKKLLKSEAECPIYLACKWVPAAYQKNNPDDLADYGNYDLADRERDGLDIQYIVIHDTETPYAPTINYFQNPTAYTSSHYVLRSSDGEITQMVKNKNVAWHAGNWYINMHSIGFEHEGYAIEGASWYTEFMYRSSARLAQWLARKYDIPLDRAHIIGHDDIPGPTAATQSDLHWDPGPYWDWSHYMQLMGAPIPQLGFATLPNKVQGVVTINPTFVKNIQSVKTCDDTNSDVPSQPTNFVHLYSAPSFDSLLIDNEVIPGPGTTRACDWGDKAATGQQFYRVERQGEWDAIYYSGQKAWFYNPNNNPTANPTLKNSLLVTPKTGKESIPVYGRAYPEASAYLSSDSVQPIIPLQYTIPAGQIYIATDKIKADYYKTSFLGYNPSATDDYVVEGEDEYYLIFFNHRFAFVKATDVDIKGNE